MEWLSAKSKWHPILRGFQRPWVFWLFCLLLCVVLYGSKVLAIFTTAPILYLTLGQGPLSAGLLWFCAGLFVSLSNPLDAGFLVLSSGLACILAGVWVRQHGTVAQAIWRSMGIISVGVVLLFSAIQVFQLEDRLLFLQEMKQEVHANLDHFYAEMQLGDQAVDETAPAAEKRAFFQYWALALLPGGLIALTALTTWMYFIMLRRSAAQLGFERAYRDLSTWQSPEYLIWAVILTLLSLVFKLDAAKVVTANVMVVLAMVYLFQGISVVVYVVKNATFSPLWKFTIYLLAILFFKVTAFLFMGLGLMDVWIDFRKLKSATQGGGKRI